MKIFRPTYKGDRKIWNWRLLTSTKYMHGKYICTNFVLIEKAQGLVSNFRKDTASTSGGKSTHELLKTQNRWLNTCVLIYIFFSNPLLLQKIQNVTTTRVL